MGRTSVRAAAVVTLAALFTGTAATASFGAAPEEVRTPIPIDSPAGRYIVLLKDAPLATYEGGESGIARTKPAKGKQLDAHSANSQKYIAHLKKQQRDIAADAGVEPATTYQVTLNGFAADLTGAEVAELRGSKDVLAVYPDEVYHPTATPSTEFLGLGSGAKGTGGVWDEVGGVKEAGKGVVVGVIDTGIAADNPSFAGAALKKTPGADPYTVNGDTIVFNKADGGQFRSTIEIGQSWNKHDYNTKLIGARHFSDGAAATGFDFSYDYLSPLDGDGHGSHTASTAAGNFGVKAAVEGVDFGKISGVAPAAKVASYKACYVGPDDLVTSDDICAGSDLLAAIDQAVADGVDVINYSIGGGAATTVLAADDIAFFNAAAAGVFVSVSAGNDGPGASTADHASPWYMTVAASTIPTYEGTVQLPNGFEEAGASVSVPFGQTITGPVVYAGDVAKAGAAPAEAALCFLGTLDPAKVTGKIVVCDRGTNARVEKSQEVEAAGGTAMILVNVTAGSLDNDFHSVPTVHLNAEHRTALLDYVRNTANATATLVGDNVTGEETPTPVVAGFSSRGPMLADGSDVIKPDVTAPGVAILAATHNGPKEAPTFGFKSGTSMSSPHVAGLGALYLGERPLASPSEIKSALMTTAYDSKNADGSTSTDPFAQGAGHVDPTKYFDAGLLYLNGPADWASYLQGLELYDFGVEPTDASDLNLASIGIGSLAGPQTVTRSVTSTKAGTFTATAAVPGIDVTVEPSTLTFSKAGETKTFTVTLAKGDADVEAWSTGYLTWNGAGTSVRSPIAVFPVTADAPASVEGSGADGSVEVEITPGLTGDLPLNLAGLAKEQVLVNGNEKTGEAEDGYSYYVVKVEEGAELARFALDSAVAEPAADLDLFVYRVVSPTDWRYYETWTSASAAADESVQLAAPTAGYYLVEAHVYSYTAPFTWTGTSAVVMPTGEGSLTATPNPIAAQESVPTTFDLSWSGLGAGDYWGVVRYGDSQVRTVVSVDVP